MKAPFKIGQDVVCVDGLNWFRANYKFPKRWEFWKKPQSMPGPKKDEICEVVDIYYSEGEWYIRLLGYVQFGGYDTAHFRALESQSISLKEQAKEVIKEVLIHEN